jgi:peroxiredoxin Q/BCP
MKSSFSRVAALLVLASLFSGAALSLAEVSVNVGDEAPDFELSDSAGKVYKLSDFRGKKAVILEFFRSGDW